MFKFFKNLFSKKKDIVEEDQVEYDPLDDPMMVEAIRRCWQSEKVVSANRDADGNVTITEHDFK